MISALLSKTRLLTSMYAFRHLDSLGGSFTYGRAINNQGQVVGDSYLNGDKNQHAFLFSRNQVHDIGLAMHDNNSVAYAINNSSTVVGHYCAKTLNYNQKIRHAFMYDHDNNTIVKLGTLGGKSSVACDINDQNQIVGYAQTDTGATHAYLFDGIQNMQDLGTLGGLNSVANAINNNGQVVGYASINETDTHAFHYSDGIMTSLGTLGGDSSVAHSINDYGQIVGAACNQYGNDQAFLYDPDKRPCMQNLGSLGGLISIANSVNNTGQVVGYSFVADNSIAHAFLYQNDNMIDLNQLLDSKTRQAGWVLNEALAINDHGSIVGIAYNDKQNMPSCAFVLSIDLKASASYVRFLTSSGLPITKNN